MSHNKPNLIYVFADQMRGTDMGCAGNREVFTPNLDRMASEGFMFKNAVSCFPVCTPARGIMFSGRYPTTTGVLCNDVPLPLDGKGFGHELKRAGYRTGYIGKWHLFGPSEVRETYIPPGPHRHGFDDLWAVINCRHQYFKNFFYLNDSQERINIDRYEPEVQTDIAMDFITKYKDEPFAMVVSMQPPHDPFEQVPQKYKDMYDPDQLTWRPNVKEPSIPKGFEKTSWYRSFADKEMLRDYYAAITALDDNMGRLMDHLKSLGLDRNTIVVFSSDHGEMMYSHGAMQKGHSWEESINVPFIVRYPDAVKSGTSSMAPFNTPDLIPTLFGLMGIAKPSYAEGKDLSHLVKGQPGETPEAAYIMCAFPWILPEWRGVRTERYTYAKTLTGGMHLFDNIEDPYQMNNLIGKPEAAELEARMEQLTNRMGAEIGDSFEPWAVIEKRMEARRQDWRHTYNVLIETKK